MLSAPAIWLTLCAGAECFPPHGAGGGGGKGGEGGGDLTGASNRGALSISPGEEFGAVGSRKGNARAGSASGDKLAEVRPSSFGGSLGGDGGGSGIQAAYVPDKPEMVLEATPGGPPRVHPLRNSLTLKSQLAVQAGVPAKVEAEPNKEKSHMAAPATTATCHDNGGGRSRGAGGSSNSAGARGTGGWRRQLADTCAVALEGMRMVAASPYLLHVCAFLLLSAVTSSFFYFQRAAVVAGAVADPVQRRVVIAHIHSMSAVATVALQLTLTGKLLTGAGVATALSASPLVAVLGMSAIALWPTPIVVATCEALRKVVTYVLTRPARELLFTVVSQEEKYKCKVAIDTLVQRLGDVAAAGVYRVLATWLMLGPSAVAACAIPVCAMWLVVGHTLGRRQQLLAKHSAAVHLN